MKLIVTGGSGYLGVHVRRFFNASDFSRRSGFNILNPSDLSVLTDYDAVIHLAAHLEKDPAAHERCFQINAEGTANVLRTVRPGTVFIYASTKDVYGAHAEAYDEVPETCPTTFHNHGVLEWSKLIGEKYVEFYARQKKLRACIFRISTVYARPSDGNEYGFVTHYTESVKRRRSIQLPMGGKPVREILHVEDFSRACQRFIESDRDFGLYNLGGGKENSTSLQDLVTRIGHLIDIEPVVTFDERQQPTPFNYISDLTLIRKELGWTPRIGIEEGLRSLL